MMQFELDNTKTKVQVTVVVDGKEILCAPGKAIKIEGKEVTLYLPEYKNKDKSELWDSHTYGHTHLHLDEIEYSLRDRFFDLDLKSGTFFNFEVNSEAGHVKKIICAVSDGKFVPRQIKYPLPKF